MKRSQYLLIIGLVISVILNVLLFTSLGVNQLVWEDEYNTNTIQWCVLYNAQADITNDLLIELTYYDNSYAEIDLFDALDCWSIGEEE